MMPLRRSPSFPLMRSLLLAVLLAAAVAACGGGKSKSSSKAAGSVATTETTEQASDSGNGAGETASTLPAGAIAGLDDYDGDGQPDPTCGTQDFGAGLELRIPCEIRSASDPPEGVTLVKDSLFRLPTLGGIDLTGISGDIVQSRDKAGAKVFIIVFNTDALFESGSATIGSTDTLDGCIKVVNKNFPDGVVQVRGHTDATGTASANQRLSDQRAGNVKDYLQSHGLRAKTMTAVGFASTRPLALERKPDGSDEPAGRAFNRRVEVVVRIS